VGVSYIDIEDVLDKKNYICGSNTPNIGEYFV
jgi:hypothetical protein